MVNKSGIYAKVASCSFEFLKVAILFLYKFLLDYDREKKCVYLKKRGFLVLATLGASIFIVMRSRTAD